MYLQYGHLGAPIPEEFMLPGENETIANIRLARDRVTTSQTTTGRRVTIAPGDIRSAQQCVDAGGRWNPVRYNCDMTQPVTEPETLKPPITEADPYAQERANCAMRTGFVWNPTRNACESVDPYVEQKNPVRIAQLARSCA